MLTMDHKTERMCAFSILKAMYEEKYNDFIDCYVPIVIHAFGNDQDYCEISAIIANLNEFFKLPDLSVKQVLDRAVQKGYIEKKEGKEEYRLKSDTITHFIDKYKEIKQRIKDLDEDMNRYAINCTPGYRFSISLLERIYLFIKNEGFLVNFRDISSIDASSIKVESSDEHYLWRYLHDSNRETSKTIHLQTFLQMTKGIILSSAFDWNDLRSIRVTNFRRTNIFLDANIIFSILEFHGDRFTSSTLKLLEYIKFFDFQVYVFDFTLEQICQVLRSYDPNINIPKEELEKPGVINVLKKKERDKNYVEHYIKNIHLELEKYNIKIYKTDIGLKHSQTATNKQLADFIELYEGAFSLCKPKYPVESAHFNKQHDLAVIMMIQNLRGPTPAPFDDSRAIFLTSDLGLVEFNHRCMQRINEDDLAEVIADTALTSVLCILRKGGEDTILDVDRIITAYAQNLFVKREVWDKFEEVYGELSKKEEYKIENLPHLFFLNIASILTEFTKKDIAKITPEFFDSRRRRACEEMQKLTTKEDELKKMITRHEDEIGDLKGSINSMQTQLTKSTDTNTKSQKTIKILKCAIFVLIILCIAFFLYFLRK